MDDPPDREVVVTVVVVAVVVVVVSVLVEEVGGTVEVVVVSVLEVEQVTIASSPSPPPVQPLPREIGNEALAVLAPMARDVTKNTKTKPTRTRAVFPVLILFPLEMVDPVNMILRYGF